MSICQLPRICINWNYVLIGSACMFAIVILSYADGQLNGQEMVKQITTNEKLIVLKRETALYYAH